MRELNDYAVRRYVAVFDGKVAKCLYDAGAAAKGTFHGNGFIQKEARHQDASNSSIMAVLLNYRALRVNLGDLTPENFSLGTGNGMIDGRSCLIVVERAQRPTKGRRTYWVDTARDFVVLRVNEASIDDDVRIVFKLDISYQGDGVSGWCPATWTGMTLLSNNRVGIQFTAKVTQHQINPDIPHAEFEIDFPAGTYVADSRSGNSYYIVRDHVAHGQISEGEIRAGIPYEKLVATETDEVTSQRRRIMRISVACATCFFIVGLFIWRVNRRRGIRRAASPNTLINRE